MKISIITVVFNNEKTIESAIKSILSQTYQNIEYIIIDGGSTDRTNTIIKQYASKTLTHISEPDNGIYDAMNKGIKMASGDVIGILNSDDLYEDDTVIQDVMDCFGKDADLDILYGDVDYVKSDDVSKVVRRWRSSHYYDKFFEHGHVPPHPALFVRTRVYKQAGLFDTSYKLAADYEFMFRTFKKYNFKSLYLNRLIVKMRLGGASNNSFKNILQANKEVIRSWKKNNIKVPVMLVPVRIVKRLRQFIKKD